MVHRPKAFLAVSPAASCYCRSAATHNDDATMAIFPAVTLRASPAVNIGDVFFPSDSLLRWWHVSSTDSSMWEVKTEKWEKGDVAGEEEAGAYSAERDVFGHFWLFVCRCCSWTRFKAQHIENASLSSLRPADATGRSFIPLFKCPCKKKRKEKKNMMFLSITVFWKHHQISLLTRWKEG